MPNPFENMPQNQSKNPELPEEVKKLKEEIEKEEGIKLVEVSEEKSDEEKVEKKEIKNKEQAYQKVEELTPRVIDEYVKERKEKYGKYDLVTKKIEENKEKLVSNFVRDINQSISQMTEIPTEEKIKELIKRVIEREIRGGRL